MNYSICIRTLGTAGKKYEKLLKSIGNLSIKPKEVIIVIPNGYTLPDINLENQRIVYSEKGMLLQRIVGYEEAKTEYVLLLDDDVEFEEDMIQKLSKPILKNKANITFPIYKELLPVGGVRSIIAACTLAAVPRRKKDDYFVKLLPSAGYSYNNYLENSEKWLYSESAPGMCVFAKKEDLLQCKLRDERWVENTGYALRDDAIFVYKAILSGYKCIGVQDIHINHLDAGSSESNRNLKASYANGYNHLIFWKRFIYKKSRYVKKCIAILAIMWWAISTIAYLLIKLLASKDIELFKVSIKGILNGVKDLSKY